MPSLDPRNGVLGTRLAAHLLRRCTYCPSRPLIDQFATRTASEAVSALMNFAAHPLSMEEPIDPDTGEPWIINDTVTASSGDFLLNKFVRAWWTNEALQDPTLRHKMMYFLHTNFSVVADTLNSKNFFDHLLLLRFYALGNFRILSQKITLDNVMLAYLNNNDNRRDNPNENYAREFLELFTIGKGPQIAAGDYTHYTEADVVTAARVLTGFSNDWDRRHDQPDNGQNIDPDTGIHRGIFYTWAHDTTDKTFSHAFGNATITGRSTEAGMLEELVDFVNMIFNQAETARAVCRRIYRFFVRTEISTEVEQTIIEGLATTFRNSDYNLGTVMTQLLESQHFYDEDTVDTGDETIGSLVKSPLELLLGTLSFFQIPIPDPISQSEAHYREFFERSVEDVIFARAAYEHFKPGSVAGYPAYYQEPGFRRNWFNSTSIIARYKLPEMLISGRRVISWGDLGTQVNLVAFIENAGNISDPGDAVILVTELLEYLFCETPDADRLDYFLNTVFLNGLNPLNWYFEWQNYQNTGMDADVKIPLEKLFTSILYSPEYQVF